MSPRPVPAPSPRVAADDDARPGNAGPPPARRRMSPLARTVLFIVAGILAIRFLPTVVRVLTGFFRFALRGVWLAKGAPLVAILTVLVVGLAGYGLWRSRRRR